MSGEQAYGSTNPDNEILARLEAYAYGIGVGYQISNDLLDGMGDYASLGKQPRSDQVNGRTTFFTNFSTEQALVRMEELLDQSLAALDGLERSEPLCWIVETIRQQTFSVCQTDMNEQHFIEGGLQ